MQAATDVAVPDYDTPDTDSNERHKIKSIVQHSSMALKPQHLQQVVPPLISHRQHQTNMSSFWNPPQNVAQTATKKSIDTKRIKKIVEKALPEM